MLLDIIILGGLAAHIYVPSIWFPLWYIGPLAVCIISKHYIQAIIWIIAISIVLTQTSLTIWWINFLYYGIWGIGVYFFSRFFDRGWGVQTILGSVWLLVSLLIVSGFTIPFSQVIVFVLINALWHAISLQIAHKYNIYEQIN